MDHSGRRLIRMNFALDPEALARQINERRRLREAGETVPDGPLELTPSSAPPTRPLVPPVIRLGRFSVSTWKVLGWVVFVIYLADAVLRLLNGH